jgi:hypothetical protein
LGDSISLTGTDLDTGLSSILQALATAYPVLDSYLGSWASSDELVDYLGPGAQSQAFLATCIVVRAGEDPDAWVSIPNGETSSQTVADLESSYWVLLDDLVCGLTENAFVPIQSILVYQPDGTSNAVVYVSLSNTESTLSTLPLDYNLRSFLYADITGVSSDLGFGNDLAVTPPSENLTSDLHSDTPTPKKVWFETDPLASKNDLAIDSNLAVDSTSDSLAYTTSSSLDLNTDHLDSSFDVAADLASNPSDLNGLGVTGCS